MKEESKYMVKEQTKAKQLILSILPKQIFEQLREYDSVIAEQHDGACVMYADVVGFTVMSGEMSPAALLTMLNSIFLIFDQLCRKYGLQKLKTLGDCVVVAGGVSHEPGRKETREDKLKHIENLLHLSLEIHEAAKQISEKMKRPIQFRAGVAAGYVVAGVIGKTKFAYDMWGDAVKEANLMESTGIPGRTQVTRQIRKRMDRKFDFERNPREEDLFGFLVVSAKDNIAEVTP